MADCPRDTTWIVNGQSIRANHGGCPDTVETSFSFECRSHDVAYVKEGGRWSVHPRHRRYIDLISAMMLGHA